MRIRFNSVIAFASIIYTACLGSWIQAQTSFTIPFAANQTSPSVTLSVDANGILMATGPGTGSSVLTSSEQGAGSRMLWYPEKSAFRAGSVSGTQWDEANIGVDSVALGQNVIASSFGTISIGYANSATTQECIAIGNYSTASAPYAGSIAIGGGAIASADYAVAIGVTAHAVGAYSQAIGDGVVTSGMGALATGMNTTSSGTATASFNTATVAQAYASSAFGRYNVGGYGTNGQTNWLLTDPLFEIGMGTSTSARADALIVYKNGNTWINGSDNELPHQALVGPNSILTEGLADSRYLSVTGGSSSATSLTLFTGASATGADSVALGYHAAATGAYSSALGSNTTATAYGSTVIGQYNIGGGSSTTWSGSDPLFEIGNGTSSTQSDALVVYQNGNAQIQEP